LGEGRIVFLPENPEPALEALAEAEPPDAPALARQVELLADTIEASAGPMPLRITVRDLADGGTCVDTVLVGLRGTADQRLLVAVSHRAVPVEVSGDLRDEAWRSWKAHDSLPCTVQGTVLTLHLAPRGHRVLFGERRQ